MRQAVYDDDERLIEWAAARIGVSSFRSDAHAIGLVHVNDVAQPDANRDSAGRRIAAVTVMDGFSECDANMHIASDGSGLWLTREFLVRSFAYAFIQCGLRRVTGLVPAKNTEALRFDMHLGFRLEGRCRDALPDDDVLVLGMLRADCRYISKEHRR